MFISPKLSLEWLKLKTSNFVHWLSLGTTNWNCSQMGEFMFTWQWSMMPIITDMNGGLVSINNPQWIYTWQMFTARCYAIAVLAVIVVCLCMTAWLPGLTGWTYNVAPFSTEKSKNFMDGHSPLTRPLPSGKGKPLPNAPWHLYIVPQSSHLRHSTVAPAHPEL